MLWSVLKRWVFRLCWFLIPGVPTPLALRKIEPNTPCPACGNTAGRLDFRQIYGGNDTTGMPMVVHTCMVCGCAWGEHPLRVPEFPINIQGLKLPEPESTSIRG